MTYKEFLESKRIVDRPSGFEPDGLPQKLFDWQCDVTRWACRRGRAALFEDCGLGKTIQQLAWASQVQRFGKVLILTPLAVAHQTIREAEKFGLTANFCDLPEQVQDGITVTNYEKLHKFDPSKFAAVVLDESSILKSLDGKTKEHILQCFKHTPYKLACTATPAPNDYMELGNHAEFLGVMTRGEMLSMFFVHDGGETSKWRLKGHAEEEFWKWICSWAVNIRMPSDLGYNDDGFILPELRMQEHIVESSQKMDGYLLPLPASSLMERRDARRASLVDRVNLAADLANSNDEQWCVWCDLNSESKSASKLINKSVEVTGSDSDYHKEQSMIGFTDGKHRCIVTKPSICGFGMNWQHCHNIIYLGLSDSYEQFYQSMRRFWRFGQKQPVNVHLVISNLEGAVLANIKRKEADSRKMAENMCRHMAKISSAAIKGTIRTDAPYNPRKRFKLPQFV